MTAFQVIILILLCVFYVAYLAKAVMLKRRGITVNQLGKGEKPTASFVIELILGIVTLMGAVVQFCSALFPGFVLSLGIPGINLPFALRVAGMVLVAAGVVFFISAMFVMKDNWRAGFNENQNTKLVTRGVYNISRNPAFVGFDLLYIGCAIAFPNIFNIAAAVAAVVLFHFQILGEEKYCAEAFGGEYDAYKRRTLRYMGKL